MNKNTKLILTIIISMMIMFDIGQVLAADRTATCFYGVPKWNVTYKFVEKDGKQTSSYDFKSDYGNYTGYVTSMASSLFIGKDTLLKCPEKIYYTDKYNDNLMIGQVYISPISTGKKDEKSLNLNQEKSSYTGNVKQTTPTQYKTCTFTDIEINIDKSTKKMVITGALIDKYKDVPIDSTGVDVDKLLADCNKNTIYTQVFNNSDTVPKPIRIAIKTTKDDSWDSDKSLDGNQSNADQLEEYNKSNAKTGSLDQFELPFDDSTEVYSCEGLLDDDLIEILQMVLKIVRIVAPILLIVMMSIDFGGAVLSQDQDALKKAGSKAIKRTIAAIALFFVPYLVGMLLTFDGISAYTSSDPTCGL